MKNQSSASAQEGQPLWIDKLSDLIAFCDEAKRAPFIAVDTEFHREKTYFSKLALVQVAFPGKIACIDPLALGDLSPLDELLLDENLLKVMHAGRQDLEIFYFRTGKVPAPLFDTQVAAALLGMGEQTGYGALVEKVCRISLEKSHVLTDWMHRPLAPDVIAYAADDVRYLGEVYSTLDASLKDKGRRSWLDEEQAVLLDPATYEPDLENAWMRIKGGNAMTGHPLAIMRALAAWRETTARETDRPRRWVLSDDMIIAIARQRPRSLEALERIRGLDERARKMHGRQLVALVDSALKAPAPAAEKREPRGGEDDALTDALMAVLKVRARENNISPGMLATRGDLGDAAAGKRDLPLFKGWRKVLAGDAVTAFLEGRLKIGAMKGRLILE